MAQVSMLSDERLSRYGLLEYFNASVARTGTRTETGTWTTGVTAIALCTLCSRAYESATRGALFVPIEIPTICLYNVIPNLI